MIRRASMRLYQPGILTAQGKPMALESLSTAELAARLARIKHGVGDPVKNNTLFAACAQRLRDLDVAVPGAEPEQIVVKKPGRMK